MTSRKVIILACPFTTPTHQNGLTQPTEWFHVMNFCKYWVAPLFVQWNRKLKDKKCWSFMLKSYCRSLERHASQNGRGFLLGAGGGLSPCSSPSWNLGNYLLEAFVKLEFLKYAVPFAAGGAN
ncbi:hypothetical protein SDJN02_13668, partial [Cucurbita argyrosperma subsp. argyrosperma]